MADENTDSGSIERVAFDLMGTIERLDSEHFPKDKDGLLRPYRQCLSVVGGMKVDKVLEEYK